MWQTLLTDRASLMISLVSESTLYVSHFHRQNVTGSSLRFSVLPQPVERSWRLNPPNLQLFDNLLHHLSHSCLMPCVTPAQMNQIQVHTFFTVTVELIIAKTVLPFPHAASLQIIALGGMFDWLIVLAPRLLIYNFLIIYQLVYQYFVCCSSQHFLLWDTSIQFLALFMLEMFLGCHSAMLLTDVLQMTLNLTFSFPLAVHSVRHSFVDGTSTCQWTAPLWRLIQPTERSFHHS